MAMDKGTAKMGYEDRCPDCGCRDIEWLEVLLVEEGLNVTGGICRVCDCMFHEVSEKKYLYSVVD